MVYAGLTGFCFSGSQPLAEDPLSGGPRGWRDMADDLDDLNVAHAQVSPDSWRGCLSCAYAFILTLVDTSSYSGLKRY